MLFTWMIPHGDDDGRLQGDVLYIKGIVFPMVDCIVQDVEMWLSDLMENELIEWYEADGEKYVQINKWANFQKIRKERHTPSNCPPPQTPDKRQTNDKQEPSGVSPILDQCQAHVDHTPDQCQTDVKPVSDTCQPHVNQGDDKCHDNREEDNREEDNINNKSQTEGLRLADLLFSLILENNPSSRLHATGGESRKKKIRLWAADMEKLIGIDKQEPSFVEEVMRFSQDDDFWRSNILSGKKLRDKWDQLVMKMKGGRNGRNRGGPGDAFGEAGKAPGDEFPVDIQ